MNAAVGPFLVVIGACTAIVRVEAEDAASVVHESVRVDYARDVLPILARHCFACHGPDAASREADLRLDVHEVSETVAGEHPVIKPGDAGANELIRRLETSDSALRMPPADSRKPLRTSEIEILRRWIDEGAARSVHWAFQPVKRPVVTDFEESASHDRMHEDTISPQNPVDSLIRKRLLNEGISPSPEADGLTLLRRLSFDLTGLLPSVTEISHWQGASSDEIYLELVDRLLASPQFAEHWARHWLDVARYADSTGFETDAPRPMWKYRDWVIQSISENMPFDEFVVRQVAGDLLDNATVEDRMATGFLLCGPQDGGSEAARLDAVVDRTNTIGNALLGLTLGCAQCHTHKFDPVSQHEYYQLFAFINQADEHTLESTPVLGPSSSERTTTIFVRGDYSQPGAVVSPGVPAVLPPVSSQSPEAPNRLEFARWLVSHENPLTARVTVNRVWQHLFGCGIVETENDFGLQGAFPEHPELLDWLAGNFMDNGWDLKRLVRTIVTSSTYRQASDFRDDLKERDPENRLLARQSRFRRNGESIRDAALSAAGLLSSKVGGPGVFPIQPDGIMLNRATPAEWVTSPGEDRHRRTMYTYYWRLTPHPLLQTFDVPDALQSCTRRRPASTPLQPLAMLNDPIFVECADRLGAELAAAFNETADRLLKSDSLLETEAARRHILNTAFVRCLGRFPDETESAILIEELKGLNLSSVSDLKDGTTGASPAAEASMAAEVGKWSHVVRILFSLEEFVVRD